MPKLTQRVIEQLAPGPNEFCLWDAEVVGLGVRVRPSGAKSFLLMYRWGGRQRKHTMGRLEVGYGLKEARDRARELLRGLRDGIDPQTEKIIERSAITVAELFEAYLLDGPAIKPEKKTSSWKTDQGIYECHVKPLLGKRLARDLTKLDIARFQMDVAQGKTARDIKLGHRKRSRVQGGRTVAGLSVAILGAAFQFGIDADLVNLNPARGVKRYQVARRERYLSERELSAVGEALAELDRASTRNVVMTDAVRMLILTGCRKSEILTLRWKFVDRHRKCLRLSESKTGPRVVPLADAAMKLLDRRWRESQATSAPADETGIMDDVNKRHSEFVFPAMKGAGNLVGVPKMWERVRIRADQIARQRALELSEHSEELASLVDVRLHDLRHSFASFAIADGASLFMVGKVLGHKQARTTEIYAHLSDDPLRSVANRTASRLAETMRL